MSRYCYSVVCLHVSVCRLSVTFVNCGQTVRDRPMVTMRDYWEVDISLSESANKFDLGWPWRGHFKVTKVKIACGVSCLRDGNHACHRTPNLIRWHWPPSRLIWRHESAIPATAGLLVFESCHLHNMFWLYLYRWTSQCIIARLLHHRPRAFAALSIHHSPVFG